MCQKLWGRTVPSLGHSEISKPLSQEKASSKASSNGLLNSDQRSSLTNLATNRTYQMTEPPAKRAKRTDSSAMWERNTSRRSASPYQARPTNGNTDIRDRNRRDDRERHHGRDDKRYRSRSRDRRRERSRSRDRVEKRRDRSYSRERDSRRHHRDGERNGGKDRRDREMSRSRERHRPRRG